MIDPLAHRPHSTNQGKVFFSNRLEVLLELLIEQLYTNGDPLYTPKVIIPSREMGRWVRREVADRLGIACNLKTLFLHEALKTPLPSKVELAIRIYPEIADLDYVRGDDKRRMLLAQTLAGFFQRYALYGVTFEEDWQKRVWETINLKIDCTPKGFFHLFAFSHIPEPLFASFSASHFYHLSPCQEFWSDLSKHEEGHLFLGSCGKVGRKFAAMVENSHEYTSDLDMWTVDRAKAPRELSRRPTATFPDRLCITTESYYLPPEGPSALEQFQRGMLDLNPSIIVADDSVALHLVSTKRREIEVLHQELMSLSTEPKDVLIMAPDITLYRPYIEAIFDHYQIADMPALLNEQVRGLKLLLNLEKRRYSSRAFLELFRHPLFYRRWSESELEQIRQWIQQSGIRWGMDAAFRERLLGRFEEGATWEKGFDQLLEDLALGDSLSFTEAELLGEWIETIRALYAKRPEGEKSMDEWVDCVRTLCDDFFVESKAKLWLFRKLETVRQAERMPFEAFALLMEEELKGEGLTINPNQLQVYRFSSLLPMRSIPAKVIWLLGMDLEAFPRLDKRLSFDLSRTSRCYSPSRVDFDRYLFLESILSAREKFVISTIGRDPLDNQKRPLSSVVSDFLDHFVLTPIEHPAKSYEEPATAHDYEMALAAQRREPLVVPFALRIAEAPLQEAVIDIAELLRLARSPLKHYFRHKLGMRFWQEESVKEEEEFVLSPRSFAHLRSEAMQFSLEEAMGRAKRRGDYPLGLFERVANQKCSQIEEPAIGRIEWHEHVKKPLQVSDTLWHYPAIRVGPVTIVGGVDGAQGTTLYLPKKADLRSLFSHWPLLLLFDEVHFLDETKRVDLPLEPFLRYFFTARESLSPLLPTWVKPILQEDSAGLEREMAAPTFDQALLWSASGRLFPPAKQLIAMWKPEAEKLYGEVMHDWF